MVALALGLVHAGGVADALVTIDEALERCEGAGEGWVPAELHHVRGKTLLSGGASGANLSAEVAFLQSLDIARERRVLSWELRAPTSLARLLHDHGRSANAMALLQPV